MPMKRYAVPRAVLLDLALLTLVVFLCAAWYLYVESQVTRGEWGFSLDDSWIYATFARNIATGQGYAFNPGQPTAGATGPLYALLLAVLAAVFRDVILPAKALGIACLAASSITMYFTLRSIHPGRRLAPFFGGLLIGVSPLLLWGALSGMEIPLYILVATLGIHAYVRERWMLAAFWWSLGAWIRPDGLLLAAAGIFLQPRPTLRRVGAAAAVAAPAILALFAFHLWIGGRILPNSVYVKIHPGANLGAGVWEMLREWAPLWGLTTRAQDLAIHSLVLLPAMIVGAVVLLRRYPALPAFAFGFPLALAVAGASGGQNGRYIMPMIPFGILLAVEGIDFLASRLPRWGGWALGILALAALAGQGGAVVRMGKVHGWNVENINDMQRYLARSIQENSSPGDTIAVNDVGAMGYFSGCYVVDLVGLVSPRRSFPENLAAFRPKFLVIFPGWYRDYLTLNPATKKREIWSPDSTFKYVPVAGAGLRFNTICARDQMFVFARVAPNEEGPPQVQMVWH